MKTIFDLSAFLKRNENLSVSVYFKNGRFYAASPSIEQHANDLGDALEHVAEEYRRRANSMPPMRDNGTGKAGDCAVAPQYQHATLNIQAQPATSTATAQYPTCSCGRFVRSTVWLSPPVFTCRGGHTWTHGASLGPGSRIKYDDGRVFESDGTNWIMVSP